MLCSSRVAVAAKAPTGEKFMDLITILIIVLVIAVLGGGGWYGRGRWF